MVGQVVICLQERPGDFPDVAKRHGLVKDEAFEEPVRGVGQPLVRSGHRDTTDRSDSRASTVDRRRVGPTSLGPGLAPFGFTQVRHRA